MIPSCFVLRGRETGTEIFSAHEVFLHQVEGTPCSRKRVKKPSVVCVLHVTNRCFRCLFVLDSHAESRFCKKCHLVVITVEVEMPSVGHNSWQKAEKVLADSAGLALRSSGCFRNEARNLPVTSYWQSCLKPRGIFCGCIVIVKNLRDVPRTDWSNSTV